LENSAFGIFDDSCRQADHIDDKAVEASEKLIVLENGSMTAVDRKGNRLLRFQFRDARNIGMPTDYLRLG
jgi:hypothetical protein